MVSVYAIEHAQASTPEERSAVLDGLRAYNLRFVPQPNFAPVVFLLRDSRRRVAGGLVGETGWGWLHIYWLWIEEAARGRGIGREILELAEREARNRGCTSAWLDTFEFQARAFYERSGYRPFGTLENYPPGSRRFFMEKRL